MTRRFPSDSIPLVVALGAALLISANAAHAAVTKEGNVFPATYPFAQFDIGVTRQIVDTALDPSAIQFEYERGENIEIGRTSGGSVRVTASDDMRWEHLILGGSAEDNGLDSGGEVETANELLGSAGAQGEFNVEGNGTSFNNHPLIIPTEYQDIFFGNNSPEQTFFPLPPGPVDIDIGGNLVPFNGVRSQDVGFDAYIGLTGDGALYLNTGARMEIEDAFIVAYGPGSVSTASIDGAGTYLAVYGGLNPNATTPNRSAFAQNDGIHQMVIGAYGRGSMDITNGAVVDAFYGAAIGVVQSDGDADDTVTMINFSDDQPTSQGGTVTVDGAGSTWNIMISALEGSTDTLPTGISAVDGGALAIGAFDINDDGYTEDDQGAGALIISNGGQVNARRAAQSGDSVNDRSADVRIGDQGVLDMRGGYLYVQDQLISDGDILANFVSDSQSGGPTPEPSVIEVSTFENRALGELSVGAGQMLRLVARANTGDFAPNTPSAELFIAGNFGLINVTGTSEGPAELRYERSIPDPEITEPYVSQSTRVGETFYNAAALAPTGTDPGEPAGQIIAKDSELSFQHGIWNSGDIQFTGGDNMVVGRVMNDQDPATALPRGAISLTNGAHVTFADAVTNDGTITLSDDSSASFLGAGPDISSSDLVGYHGIGDLNLLSTGDLTVSGNFVLGDEFDLAATTGIGGQLRLQVEDFAADAYAHLVVEGDGDFGVTGSRVEITGVAAGALTPGDAIDLITVLGAADFAGLNTSISIIVPDPTISLRTVITGPPIPGDSWALTLLVVPAGALPGGLAGDYNGDGVVDAADFTVWRDNLGATSESSILNNGNGDGVVDQTDYLVWLGNYGATAGLPASLIAAAPEPSAIVLLLGSVALCGCRRRKN